MSDRKYRFNWQNPVLRKSIYPFREKKLRDFLLTFFEIDVWKSLKEADPQKDDHFQQTRQRVVDWSYERLSNIADYIGSSEQIDPTHLEKLTKEKSFLLKHEGSLPRKTRIQKTLEGLDGRGARFHSEQTFAPYPEAFKAQVLDPIISRREREHRAWQQELQLHSKHKDLATARPNLQAWWQRATDLATQILAEISADLEKLTNLAAQLDGEAQLVDHEKRLGQIIAELRNSGLIEAQVFESARFSRADQSDYLTAVIDDKTQLRTQLGNNPAKVEEIDAQLADLRKLSRLLEQGKSIILSSQLRAGFIQLGETGQFVFSLKRYDRYPQAFRNRYLAAVIDQISREREAWEQSSNYYQGKRDQADKGSSLDAWWQRMADRAERTKMVIDHDLHRLEKLQSWLDQEQGTRGEESWIGRVTETLQAMSPGTFVPGRNSRDFIDKYLSAILEASAQAQARPTAGRITGISEFKLEKINRVRQLMDSEKRFLDQEDLVSIAEQIQNAVAALDPDHAAILKSPRVTGSVKHRLLQKLVAAQTRAGGPGTDPAKLNRIKALLDREDDLLERKMRTLEENRLIALREKIDQAMEAQDVRIKNVFSSTKFETEKYAYLSREIDAKREEHDALLKELNSRWRKNRDDWKARNEQGEEYKFWKRKTDEKELQLQAMVAELATLARLKDVLDEERRLRSREEMVAPSEQIDQAMRTLGPVEPVEARVFASDRVSFNDKMDYLQALIDERSREQAEWKAELQVRQGKSQLAGEAQPLMVWWQEQVTAAEGILTVINSELDQLRNLKDDYKPVRNLADFRQTRQEKSSLARLALLRKQVELGDDLLSTEQEQDENETHDRLLKMILDMFDAQPGRFPPWLQYMVIHFSGIRYKSAHGSWFDPQDLLKSLRAERPQFFSDNDGQPPEANTASGSTEQHDAAGLIPADVEVLETLQSYKEHIPPWAWKEVVKFTPLRLDTTDPGWEQSQPERRQYDTPDKRFWNDLLNQWARPERITLWRERHRATLDVVMTSCVCNEISENTLHTRGVRPASGLTRKIDWYFNQARKTADRSEHDPLKAIFRRPSDPSDFRPGASIFWLDWKPQCLYDDQAAQASQVEHHNLLPDGISLGRRGKLDDDGWSYAQESNRIIRRKLTYADPKNPKKFNKAQIDQLVEAQRGSIAAKVRGENKALKGNRLEKAIDKAIQDRKNAMKTEQLKRYLRWTHEAIVIGVEETLDGLQVLTFETAPCRTGLNRRNVSWLVNIDNNSKGQQVFVGYVPPLNTLPDDLKPHNFLRGVYMTAEDWSNVQIRLKEMLRRDLILPQAGYAEKTYPKPAPPEEKRAALGPATGASNQQALKALPGFWVEVAPRLDQKARGKGWLNRPALDCYAVGRKSLTKTKVQLRRGWPVRVASTRKEKSRNQWHYLVTHSPDEPAAEGLYIREEDFIAIPTHRAGILVQATQETKALMFKKTDEPGKPILDSGGAKLPAGTEFMVSGVHRISEVDLRLSSPGTILTTGQKPHYLVIDCPPNRDAEGLLVRAGEVKVVREIPLEMDTILSRRREARSASQNGKTPRQPEWRLVAPDDEDEARLFKKIGTARKPDLDRQSLSLKPGTIVQIDPPETVKGKAVCRVLVCPQQPEAVRKYVRSKDLAPVVEVIIPAEDLLAAVKGALKDQASAKQGLEVRLQAKSGTALVDRLVVSNAAGPLHTLDLGLRDGRLVLGSGDLSPPGAQTIPWKSDLAQSLEAIARPHIDSKPLGVLVSANPENGEPRLALYWQTAHQPG